MDTKQTHPNSRPEEAVSGGESREAAGRATQLIAKTISLPFWAASAMKRILLIDKNDSRRMTRVMLLEHEGYEVVTANRFQDVEGKLSESGFDLVVLETDDIEKAAVAYGERLKAIKPTLPVLVLSSNGLFLPKESLLSSFHSEHPTPPEVMARIAALLMRSTHERRN